jgi:hypothetical protein
MIVETKVNVNGVRTANNSSIVAFRANFANGKSLTTRNMRLRTVLDHRPEYVVQERPNIHDPPTLKTVQDARAAQLEVPVAPLRPVRRGTPSFLLAPSLVWSVMQQLDSASNEVSSFTRLHSLARSL